MENLLQFIIGLSSVGISVFFLKRFVNEFDTMKNINEQHRKEISKQIGTIKDENKKLQNLVSDVSEELFLNERITKNNIHEINVKLVKVVALSQLAGNNLKELQRKSDEALKKSDEQTAKIYSNLGKVVLILKKNNLL